MAQYSNEPIDGSRTLSAKFDSYDQRNEDGYFVTTPYFAGAAAMAVGTP